MKGNLQDQDLYWSGLLLHEADKVIMFIFRADYAVAVGGDGSLALLVLLATPPTNGAVSVGAAFGVPEA